MHLRVETIELLARVDAQARRRARGERVQVAIDPARLHCFDAGGAAHRPARAARAGAAVAMIAPSLLLATQLVVWHSYRADEQKALDAVRGGVEPRARRRAGRGAGAAVRRLRLQARGGDPARQRARPRHLRRTSAIGDWARAGLIEPLPRRTTTRSPVPRRHRRRRCARAASSDGVPLAFKSLALFYRKDLVAPSAGDHRRARRAGERVKATRPAGSTRSPTRRARLLSRAWLHGFGGRILDEQRPPGARLRTAAIALGRLRRSRSPPTICCRRSRPASSPTQLFNDGRAALTINGPWFVGEIAPGVPFGVAPLPTVSATGKPAAPLVEMEALLMPARGHEPKAARGVRALARRRPRRRAIRARVGRQTVAARAAWDDPEVARDPILPAFRAQLAATVPMPSSPAMRQIWEPAQPGAAQVLRGADRARGRRCSRRERRVLEALRPAPPRAGARPTSRSSACFAVAGAAGRCSARARAASCRGARAVGGVRLPRAGGDRDGRAGVRAVRRRRRHVALLARRRPLDLHRPAQLRRHPRLARRADHRAAELLLHARGDARCGRSPTWRCTWSSASTLALLLRDPLLKLRGVYRVLLIVPWAVPNYITALIWKGMFHRQFGAINGLLAARRAAADLLVLALLDGVRRQRRHQRLARLPLHDGGDARRAVAHPAGARGGGGARRRVALAAAPPRRSLPLLRPALLAVGAPRRGLDLQHVQHRLPGLGRRARRRHRHPRVAGLPLGLHARPALRLRRRLRGAHLRDPGRADVVRAPARSARRPTS